MGSTKAHPSDAFLDADEAFETALTGMPSTATTSDFGDWTPSTWTRR